MVSGNFPVSIPASTFGENTSNAEGVCFAPTQRTTLTPRRLPALMIPRSASVRSPLEANSASTSSTSNVGAVPSIRNSAASLMFAT